MVSELFVDMDCVLADFIGGMAGWWKPGLTRAELEETWENGRYGFGHAMVSLYESRGWATDFNATSMENRFWNGIAGLWTFWAELEKLPWADALMATVRGSGLPYRFLTSPSDCGFGLVGKDQWLVKHFGKGEGLPAKMIPCRDKYLLARPDRLLIDDHQENVDQWIAAGGQAILVPYVHNRRWSEYGPDVGKLILSEVNYAIHGSAT